MPEFESQIVESDLAGGNIRAEQYCPRPLFCPSTGKGSTGLTQKLLWKTRVVAFDQRRKIRLMPPLLERGAITRLDILKWA